MPGLCKGPPLEDSGLLGNLKTSRRLLISLDLVFISILVLTAFLGILSVVSPGKKGVREQTTVRLKLKAKSSTISAPPDIGKETLLKHCDAHFGSQWLQKWDESAVDLCHSNNGKDQRKELESLLRCREMSDFHMTAASSPHVLCNVDNLLVDPSRAHKAACPKHRPGYMCQGTSYHVYSEGAFGGVCEWPRRNLTAFPRDHLRDIMESFAAYPSSDLPKAKQVEEVPTLLVTREVLETGNIFHVLTDLMNAYITLRMLGWEKRQRQVVILDSHPQQLLDGFWAAAVAGGGKDALEAPWSATSAGGTSRLVRRLSDLAEPTLLARAAFVPPGYTSLLFAHLYEESSCPLPTALFRGFRDFLLRPLGLHEISAPVNGPIKVTFISRRPTTQRQLVRLIDNEAEVVKMLRALPGVDVQVADLATLSLQRQLELVCQTDILVGMHGAAMAWTLLMQSHAAAVELWPRPDGVWRCYEHTSHWAGLLYRNWSNPHPQQVTGRERSDYTNVDVNALRLILEPLVSKVEKRRQQHKLYQDSFQGE